jgi:hypothetical protein
VILESVFGGILGGVLRLAPEVLKFFTHKKDLDHEYRMMQAEMEIAKAKIDFGFRQVDANLQMAELDSIAAAVKEQGQTARAAGRLVAALSALVRPLVTYWFVILYSAVKIASMSMAVDQGGEWKEVLVSSWTKDDMAILFMILGFWFVSRTIEKYRK